jgi:hypothetical protein
MELINPTAFKFKCTENQQILCFSHKSIWKYKIHSATRRMKIYNFVLKCRDEMILKLNFIKCYNKMNVDGTVQRYRDLTQCNHLLLEYTFENNCLWSVINYCTLNFKLFRQVTLHRKGGSQFWIVQHGTKRCCSCNSNWQSHSDCTL